MGTGAEVTLYTSRFTLFGHRVQIALVEKGIEADVVYVDFSNKPKELLDANPVHKKVSALVHGGKPVAESVVILEYLEDAFLEKKPLMPQGAYEKAKVRFWSDYISKGVLGMAANFRAKPGSPKQAAGIEATKTVFKTLNGAMLDYCKDGPYFTGDKFGFLDVMLGSISLFVKALANSDSLPLPDEILRFYKWAEAVKAHPALKSALPSEEETLVHVSAMMRCRREPQRQRRRWLSDICTRVLWLCRG